MAVCVLLLGVGKARRRRVGLCGIDRHRAARRQHRERAAEDQGHGEQKMEEDACHRAGV